MQLYKTLRDDPSGEKAMALKAYLQDIDRIIDPLDGVPTREVRKYLPNFKYDQR
jgi:hypothetical protein